MDVPTEYVLLGLRFDRIKAGVVEAFLGDPALRARVQDEPAPDPAALARRACALRAELPSSGLSPERAGYLRGQLSAVECSARIAAGGQVGFVEEVAAYFQVDIQPGSEQDYAAAHDAINTLLPGPGSLAARYARYRRADECPTDRLETVVLALSSALRERVRADYGIPDGETVQYDVVSGKPWAGVNHYSGGYRSRVAINGDSPQRLTRLPHLVAHESYPGHHTEHCFKERGLVGRDRQVEHAIFLVSTPQCLVAEGMADLGVRVTVGADWGAWVTSIMADLGLRVDGELAELMAAATAGLDRVPQDAALMLHERGAGVDEVAAFLRRWLMIPDIRARQMLRFLTHPLWRTHISTYVEGRRLLSDWLVARPPSQRVADRFRRLLDEPLTPMAIRAELAA